mmetsp:Transcript_23676/g.35995  ORF Transcript_23676/g.35995 Transcript_23676/m.35995 type:complete len:231 (+) Transcript_23676:1121-1813(+)
MPGIPGGNPMGGGGNPNPAIPIPTPGGRGTGGNGGAFIGGGGRGGAPAFLFSTYNSIGSVVKQSSLRVKSVYPWAATKANAARHALSIATSRVLPRPHARSDPPMRAENTMEAEAVAPRFEGDICVKVASVMRWDLVYRWNASMQRWCEFERYFLTEKDSNFIFLVGFPAPPVLAVPALLTAFAFAFALGGTGGGGGRWLFIMGMPGMFIGGMFIGGIFIGGIFIGGIIP